jgi:hypothetical protein
MAYYVIRQERTPSLILNPRNLTYCKDTAPSSFYLAGAEYYRLNTLHKKQERKQTSKCWSFGEAVVRASDKKRFYYCYQCEDDKRTQQLPSIDGTTGARGHMKSCHNRDPDTGELLATKAVSKNAVYSVVQASKMDTFKALLIRWIVCCQLAFYMLENTAFRDLVAYLNAALGALLPKARATLRKWIIAEYDDRKIILKTELQESVSKIHISFDVWTAGNWIGIISIWGYWVNSAGQRQRRLLAFRRIYRSHSGDNQAAIILEVLQEYNITSNTGYFVCDNASSNDAAVTSILQHLEPGISTAEVTARRLRCIGHIINLSARSLLDPSGSELVIAAGELEIDDLTLNRNACSWQSTGSLGKLHRLIKYILASPQRREEFGEIDGGCKAKEFDHLGLLMDNATRWNSVYRMLNRALDVKERLVKFVREHRPDSTRY